MNLLLSSRAVYRVAGRDYRELIFFSFMAAALFFKFYFLEYEVSRLVVRVPLSVAASAAIVPVPRFSTLRHFLTVEGDSPRIVTLMGTSTPAFIRYRPAGIYTMPPFAAPAASIAFWMAPESSDAPLPFAP